MNNNREYPGEEAVNGLTKAGLTQDETEGFLNGSESEQLTIMNVVEGIERAIEKEKAISWRPMPLKKGPPLPRRLGIKWPWVMWREYTEKCEKGTKNFIDEITKDIHSPWG